ncbi:hypothetical protein NFI96_018615 [Prochilodus magdalenae]|nr:hypothetical protein NFI96_018615 [Prochilodus magdalenae]
MEVHCRLAGGSLEVHWRFAGGSLDGRWKSTGGTLEVRWRFTVGSLEVHWRFAGVSLEVCWRFTGGLLEVHWRFTGGTLEVHWRFTGGSLEVHWRFTGGSLEIYWGFAGGSLEFRFRFAGGSLEVHWRFTGDCSGVVPDCHGVTQNGSGSSSVTSPALVLVETPNEPVCGGTVVSTEMDDIHTTRCTRKAISIVKDPTHPSHGLFSPLPSGRRRGSGYACYPPIWSYIRRGTSRGRARTLCRHVCERSGHRRPRQLLGAVHSVSDNGRIRHMQVYSNHYCCKDTYGPLNHACCVQYTRNPVAFNLIKGYIEQSSRDVCRIDAIIFLTKHNRKVCATPTDDWVRRALARLRWWNELPLGVRTAESLTVFKRRLKTRLFVKHLSTSTDPLFGQCLSSWDGGSRPAVLEARRARGTARLFTIAIRKPVKGAQQWSDVGELWKIEDETGCSVLNKLQGPDGPQRKTRPSLVPPSSSGHSYKRDHRLSFDDQVDQAAKIIHSVLGWKAACPLSCMDTSGPVLCCEDRGSYTPP